MAYEDLLDRLAESPDASAAKAVFKGTSSAPGLSAEYFGRLLQLYAADPAATLRLARWWRLILKHGDEPALAYRAKGAADRLAGKWLTSARAFEEAGRLASGSVDQLSYQAGAVEGYARAGMVDEAVALGQRLSQGLVELNEPNLAGRVELNVGTASLWAERNALAREWFGRALSHLSDEQAMERASAHLGLSTSHLYGGDPAIAEAEAQAARALASAEDLEYLVALCDLNLAHHHLLAGRADDAMQLLLSVREVVEDSPTDYARVEESLGDAYMRLNLYSEAADAYGATYTAKRVLPAIDVADALLGIGRAEFMLGRPGSEVSMLEAQKRYHRLGIPLWESAAILARSEVALSSNPSAAARLARKAYRLATDSGSPFLQCQSLLALAAAQIRLAIDPLMAIDSAEAIADAFGFGYSRWRVHWLRAQVDGNPLPHFRRMLSGILEDRIRQRSSISRMSFLQDKLPAIQAYLATLLADPTAEHVEEAVTVVAQCRSVTLIDEILQGNEEVARDPERRERLARLREEYAQDNPLDDSGGARRGALAPGSSALQRKWIEAGQDMLSLSSVESKPNPQCAVIVDCGTTHQIVHDGQVTCLSYSSREVAKRLKWLWFSLLEPMVTRDADSKSVLAQLAQLAEDFLGPWNLSQTSETDISPDGAMWQIPWDACAWAAGARSTASLCLHPSFSGPSEMDWMPNRVAIWLHQAEDLPHAAKEVAELLSKFPHAEIFEGLERIREALGQDWDLVHVVGHARHNAQNPMFSHLTTAEGPLFAADIAKSSMRCKWVSLSACDTANLSNRMAFEPDGLVRAFLSKGAMYLLASQWPLDDEAASRFYASFYTQMSLGARVSEALVAARETVRHWQAHPYFWGPFCVYRGYQS